MSTSEMMDVAVTELTTKDTKLHEGTLFTRGCLKLADPSAAKSRR